jgi:hypothetical protein
LKNDRMEIFVSFYFYIISARRRVHICFVYVYRSWLLPAPLSPVHSGARLLYNTVGCNRLSLLLYCQRTIRRVVVLPNPWNRNREEGHALLVVVRITSSPPPPSTANFTTTEENMVFFPFTCFMAKGNCPQLYCESQQMHVLSRLSYIKFNCNHWFLFQITFIIRSQIFLAS